MRERESLVRASVSANTRRVLGFGGVALHHQVRSAGLAAGGPTAIWS